MSVTATVSNTPISSKTNMFISRYQKAYYQAFIISLFLCLSPINALAYFAPAVALIWFIMVTRSQRVIRNIGILLFVWILLIFFHIPFVEDFAIPSAFLSIFTYSSFVVLIAIPSKLLVSQNLLYRLLRWVKWTVIIEALLGIAQSFYGFTRSGGFDLANGDYVEGTIHPWLASEHSFSNPIFAVNMVLFLLVLLPPFLLERKNKIPIVLGTLSLILASVLHVLLFLVVSIIVSFLIYRPITFRHKVTYVLIFGSATFLLLAMMLLKTNFRTIYSFAQLTFQGNTPRAQVVKRVAFDIPDEYPLMPIVGLGQGQFSSRAGLIGTGLYFGSPLHPKRILFLPQSMSTPFRKYVLDLWLSLFFDRSGNNIHKMNNTSSTYAPFFSLLSVYTELGILILLAIVTLVIRLLMKIKSYAYTPNQKMVAMFLSTGILFLFLLGLQENYWEVPQAIFLGTMLLKVQYAFLKWESMTIKLVRVSVLLNEHAITI